MASKMRRAVVRSPVSCAAWARKRCVSGSLGSDFRAWMAARMAAALSPAPSAIMPLDKASMPSFCRRLLRTLPTAAGLYQTLRRIDQTRSAKATIATNSTMARNTLVSIW